MALLTSAAPASRRLLGDRVLLKRALWDAVLRLSPQRMWRNPVMFTVWICAVYTTLLGLHSLTFGGTEPPAFTLSIALWLWFTVLFANFAEALAEGRGKAQAEALRRTRQDTQAIRLAEARRDADREELSSAQLRRGDFVWVEAGQLIPGDGDVVEGIASVDESAVTGESAPVIRESGGDRTAVTGGTRVLSDWLIVRITSEADETFLDRMIALVEGAKRRRTPNEIALGILLAALSIIFLLAVCTLPALTAFVAGGTQAGVSPVLLTALLVCLIPTTIGGLLSAIGIAGMDRMFQARVLATSGRAVEAAGDVSVLLLDKTGTITIGNRQAVAFLPAYGVWEEELAEAAQLASLSDETPEGRSIVILAKERCDLRGRSLGEPGLRFIPFTAQTRMSGVDLGERRIRKGAVEAVSEYLRELGASVPAELLRQGGEIAAAGGTPLLVCNGVRALGLVELKDVLKGGIRERFAELRRMDIRTVMVTGDNPRTAAAIAAEAGVDDYLAEATPERKLALIREHQAGGRLVAMTGDGSNDAPALAQADVAVAMNTGTQAAREAGNMVDLDSDPTKLLEVVTIGKQLLMTRGALTTFSVANDVSKYFAILPALFVGIYPPLAVLNVMGLSSPRTAVLSAVIFNALIVVALTPLALKGVTVRPAPARVLLRRNLLVYGLCGGIYPGLVSGGAWLLKAWQPDQRAVVWQGRSVGLAAVGQEFSGPDWFWSRPSATVGTPYDASASSGSTLGPATPALRERVAERCAALRALDPDNREPIPVDLVTTSGSGLDPHISPEAAHWQAARVARARGLAVVVVDSLVAAGTESAFLGIMGRPRVNVNGEPVHLTLLARFPGRVLTHRQILKDVRGASYMDQTQYLRVLMAQLRRKVEADPARPRLLLTETGVGYRFRDMEGPNESIG